MNPFSPEDIFKPEDLNPELKAFLETGGDFPMLRHPLAYSVPYSPVMNRQLNKMLEFKRARIAELVEKQQYEKILPLYERPYRLSAFIRYESHLSDEEYWRTLGWLWTDTENPYTQIDEWKSHLTADRPGREAFMDEEDRALYDSLPSTVTVYRGQVLGHDIGISWTTDPDKAKWFANRFRQGGVVLKATVEKANIIACLAGRGESEVIVLPQHIDWRVA